VAWGSPRAGPPMEKEGGVRCARSGIRMLPAHYVQRRTPCLLPVVVSPFVGARHVAHIAHAAAAGPRPVAYVLLVPAPTAVAREGCFANTSIDHFIIKRVTAAHVGVGERSIC
jgi:hypothetical protein